MKKIFASFGWILLLLPLISVAGARTAFMSHNTASYSDVRNVSGFTGVSSSGSFRIHIQFGQKESVRLEGDEDVIKNIETVVENGTLKIRSQKNINGSFWRNGININVGKIDVYVTAIKLNNLSSSGSGDMKVDGTLKTENLSTAVSGSGSISLNISSDSYTASVSGSGRIDVSGATKNATIQLSGSGDLRGSDLKSDIANIKVSGSGNVSLNVENALNAAVSGSGSIRYGGNAKVASNRSGSGRISRM